MTDDQYIIIAAIAVILLLGWYVIGWALAGAINLLSIATQHGFLGFSIFVILWVIALPIMLIISTILGIFLNLAFLKEKN
jgi:hypothetical protein